MTVRTGWRSPTVVLLAGSLIIVLGMGIRASFGIFQRPMIADLGWSREAFALAIALQQILWGVMQPVLGAVADKFGTARVVIASALMYTGGLLLMGYGGSLLTFDIGAGFMVGFGIAGTGFGVVMAAIARAFPPERRSLVFGIGTAAGSLGQLTMIPLGQAFIDLHGWSMALGLFAVIALLVIPLSAPIRGKPEVENGPDQPLGVALREAATHRGFLMLAAGYFVCGFQIAFMTAHFPAYLVDNGLSPAIGATALALVGGFNIIGSFTAGVLGQKRRKKYLLSWIYLARAIAVTAFMVIPLSGASALVFSAVMGLFWLSTVPLTTGLVGQIFGLRYLATLSGLVFFSHQVGSFLGVWLGGLLFDLTGSYNVVWWLGVVLALMAAAINLPIDDRTLRRDARPAAVGA